MQSYTIIGNDEGSKSRFRYELADDTIYCYPLDSFYSDFGFATKNDLIAYMVKGASETLTMAFNSDLVDPSNIRYELAGERFRLPYLGDGTEIMSDSRPNGLSVGDDWDKIL